MDLIWEGLTSAVALIVAGDPELLRIVCSDGDESKRASAAEELRQYDPTQFPDLAPTLINVLLNDKKPAVRAEAAYRAPGS